jgi:hypothetical protein
MTTFQESLSEEIQEMEKALFILKPYVSSSRHIAVAYSSDLSKRITRQELAQIELTKRRAEATF